MFSFLFSTRKHVNIDARWCYDRTRDVLRQKMCGAATGASVFAGSAIRFPPPKPCGRGSASLGELLPCNEGV